MTKPNPKFCKYCGAAASNGKFCTSCGNIPDAPNTAAAQSMSVGATTETTSSAAIGGGDAASAGNGSSATAVKTEIARDPSRADPESGPSRSPTATGTRAPAAASGSTMPLGAVQPTTGPPWLAIGLSVGVVVVLGAVAAVILLVAGGKPAARTQSPQRQSVQLTNTLLATRQLYVPTQQSSYSVLLPAGWQASSQNTSSLSGAVTVKSPVDHGATISVGQVQKPARTLAADGARLLRAASTSPLFRKDASTSTTLAGGRPAWELAYEANGVSTAYYIVSSCKRIYAVTANVPPARVSLLRQRIAIVAATLQGNC